MTDGTNTASVTAVKFTVVVDPAHTGNTGEETCSGLLTATPPSTTEYDSTISYTSPTAKIAPTTVTDQIIPPVSFNLTGGTVSGSFAGPVASVGAVGVPDSTTIGALTQAAPTSASPTPAFPQCQPTPPGQGQEGRHHGHAEGPQGPEEDQHGRRLHADRIEVTRASSDSSVSDQ